MAPRAAGKGVRPASKFHIASHVAACAVTRAVAVETTVIEVVCARKVRSAIPGAAREVGRDVANAEYALALPLPGVAA